jgi:hypothetical protein
MDQAMRRAGLMTRAWNSRRSSLTVIAISPIWGFGAGRGRGGEECVRGDDQGGPAVPGFPAAVLVLVQAEAGFGGLERFLDAPVAAGDGDQMVQGNRLRAPAAVERQLAGGAVAVDQHPVMPAVRVDGLGQGDECPVAVTETFRPVPADIRCQACRGGPAAIWSARWIPRPVGTRCEQATART